MSAVLDLPKTTSIDKIYKAVDMAREQQATVILSDVSWENYNRFVEETMDKFVNPRICFEEGNLLIMTVSAEHEYYNRLIAALIDILAEMFEIPWTSLGSATYRKDDIEKGFEPDSCFYFANESKIRGVKRLDMRVHPAPDLIVEVDITSLSTFREHIFAAFGVPEIWRFDGEKMDILKLEKRKYVDASNSLALPLLTSATLTELVLEAETLGRLERIKKVRNWAKSV